MNFQITHTHVMKLIFTFFMASSLVACGSAAPGSTSSSSDKTKTADSVVVAKPVIVDHSDNLLNQTARLIAGISKGTDTLFAAARSSAKWADYASESDKGWADYMAKNEKMLSWATAEVHPATAQVKTLLYPFSGPDFLYANLFFPNAETIYMCGLEEVGSIPDFTTMPLSQLDGVLDFYKTSISEVLNYSFYRTLGMKSYLHNANVDGVTPVLMLFLERAGKQIAQIDFLTLNDDGTLKVVADDSQFRKLKNRGVEIKYFNGTDNVERRLIYFTGNAADGGLAENSAYGNYYRSLCPDGGFSKSATYLMHKPYFSQVRDAILENCKVVVSDDSGIAYRFYKPEQWDVQLYGSYTTPISLFANLHEADLVEAYKTRDVKPLGFRIGYSNPSNMRIAVRKN